MTDTSIKDFEARDRRARIDRQEARGRRPAARAVAGALRARRAALALLPRAARGSRAAHRDPQRARRAEAGAAVADGRRIRRATERWPRGSDSLAAFLEQTRAPRSTRRSSATCRRPPACPAIVSEAMRYSVFAGGKRLRPMLTLAAADAVARGIGARDGVERGRRRSRAARRLRRRADPHLLADPRRPAGDGQRHAAPRPADAARRLRRRHRDPRRRRAAGRGVRAARARAGRRRSGARRAASCASSRVVADAAGAAGMVGGQAIDLQAAGRRRRSAADARRRRPARRCTRGRPAR